MLLATNEKAAPQGGVVDNGERRITNEHFS